MKKYLLLFLICITGISKAQDTLYSQDFPTSNKTYVLSSGTAFSGLDVTETGANFNWDFSDLVRTSQRVDTSYVITQTNPLLSLYFIDFQLNTNRANHAFRGQNFRLGPTSFVDIFNYYYNSTANYKQPGFGAVFNGIPVPVIFTPHDTIYKFPLKYEDEDSVTYKYSIDLTDTIGLSYHVTRSRHNKVDGWGTLKTPYGTFSAVRVKSVIVEKDSLYVTSLNLGVNLGVFTTHEYKWLGKAFGLPLVQINTNGSDSISQILYQDSVHLTAIPLLPAVIDAVMIYPNPASEKLIIRYSLFEKADVKISLVSAEGKLVAEILNMPKTTGINFEAVDLRKYNLSTGNYFIKIQAGSSLITKQVQIN